MKHWVIQLNERMVPVCRLKRSDKISFDYESLIPDPDCDISITTALMGVVNYILVKKENQSKLTEEEIEELNVVLEKKTWLLK